MEDEVIDIKRDVQHAMSRNILHYKASYGGAIFYEDNIEYLQSFEYYDKLKISIENNQLIFDVELNKDIVNYIRTHYSKKMQEIGEQIEKEKLEESYFNKLLNEIPEEMKEKLFNAIDEMQDDDEEENIDYCEPTKEQEEKIKYHKERLRETGLFFKYKQEDCWVGIGLETKEITLNVIQIRELLETAKKFDYFIIAPRYVNDDPNNLEENGIRIYFYDELEELDNV